MIADRLRANGLSPFETRTRAGRKDALAARYKLVSTDYLQVMRIGLTVGRGFTEQKTRQGAIVAGKPIRPLESQERRE